MVLVINEDVKTSRTNYNKQNIMNEKESLESLNKAVETVKMRISESLKKFDDVEKFIKIDAADSVEYYFSRDKKFRDKNEYQRYLMRILGIYLDFFNDNYPDEVFDNMDHPVQKVVTYIEENYDLLIYHGEPENNAAFRRKEAMRKAGKDPYSVKIDEIKDTLDELLSQKK